MIKKTVIITIWWQIRDDYDMMTVQGWGLTPGRAPATRPPLPPTLSATRPAQIVFLHSCSSVFVTSTNCISSLKLKCICVLAGIVFLLSWSFLQQRKLYFFNSWGSVFARENVVIFFNVSNDSNISWYNDVLSFLFESSDCHPRNIYILVF